MNLLGKTYLVTGGTGYIGRHLVRRLVDLHADVVVLARPTSDVDVFASWGDKVTIHLIEGTDYADRLFQEHNIDAVVHLAGLCLSEETPDNIQQMLACNVQLGAHVLAAMAKHNESKIFINTSSYWQYGDQHAEAPNTFYAASKQAFEDLLPYYAQQHSAAVVSLTLYDVYGPHDPRPKLLSALCDAYKNKTRLDLTLGEQKLNLVYVDDVVGAYLAALDVVEPGAHQIYFVGNKTYTLREMADIFADVAQAKIDVCWGERPYPSHQIFHPIEGEPLPSWEPTISLEEGLEKVIHHGG